MSNTITRPGQTLVIKTAASVREGAKLTAATTIAEFEEVKHLISSKPMRRNEKLAAAIDDKPQRTTPSNERLKAVARCHPPPEWWLEGGEECPF